MSETPTEAPSQAPTEAPTEGTARLLVQCPDRPGIVAAVSEHLYRHGANIVQADQYSTGGREPRFFLRLEYELAGLDAPPAEVAGAFGSEVAPRFEMEWHISYSATRPRIAILASREAHCLLDLLWRWRSSELAADVALVISNHEVLREHVEPFDVPYAHLPVTTETKPQQEQQMLELLRDRVDLVVLARYMQVLTPGFLDAFPQAAINIHHSFLPAFAGADPYGQALTRGVKIIGATAHYATPELDEGPIIEQDVVRVSHRDTRADLVRHGREVERAVLARAVRWHLEDRVLVYDNKTVVFR
ncbi:MAG: formyltetrahydrofolate deformylase [Chloroflexi bacterium]|nr:formyltetrahydrofolate deformylase [Chloroflexota bacterium]